MTHASSHTFHLDAATERLILSYPLLTAEEEQVLAREGSDEAREKLVVSNLRLVESIALKFSGCGLEATEFLFIFALFTFAVSSVTALTLLYSGEEHGQLGLHGCRSEQVGGLAHRYTCLDDLHTKYGEVLNLHTGNLIDAVDPNAEWIY